MNYGGKSIWQGWPCYSRTCCVESLFLSNSTTQHHVAANHHEEARRSTFLPAPCTQKLLRREEEAGDRKLRQTRLIRDPPDIPLIYSPQHDHRVSSAQPPPAASTSDTIPTFVLPPSAAAVAHVQSYRDPPASRLSHRDLPHSIIASSR